MDGTISQAMEASIAQVRTEWEKIQKNLEDQLLETKENLEQQLRKTRETLTSGIKSSREAVDKSLNTQMEVIGALQKETITIYEK